MSFILEKNTQFFLKKIKIFFKFIYAKWYAYL